MQLLAVTEFDVALASVVTAGVVGLATPLFGWLVARGNRRHERQLAHDARRYEARATLYADLLETLSTELQGFWLHLQAAEGQGFSIDEGWTNPSWLHRVNVEASEEVLSALHEFIQSAQEFTMTWELYESRHDEATRTQLRELLARLHPEPQIDLTHEDEIARFVLRGAAESARAAVRAIEEAARLELVDVPR